MIAATSGERIVLQPESRQEERLLDRLLSSVEPPTCWYTLDVQEYDGLDHALAERRAEFGGSFEPGTRALVVETPTLEALSDDAPTFEGFV